MKSGARHLLAFLAFACVFVAAATSHAASRRFCVNWAYSYIDTGLGEDNLLHDHGDYGVTPASYSYAEVEKDGVVIWSGFLGANGCTSYVSGTFANYTLWVAPQMQPQPGTGPELIVTPTNDQQLRWFYADFGTLPAVLSNASHTTTFGPGDNVIQVAAALARLLNEPDIGLVPGNQYWVYAEIPGEGGTSYHQDDINAPSAVWLWYNPQFTVKANLSTVWDASFKSIILHEMGHAIQHRLFGLQQNNYCVPEVTQPGDACPTQTPTLCECSVVWSPNERSHCLQSREKVRTAQTEGFGHFIASIVENRATDTDAWYPYYKNIWIDDWYREAPIGIAVGAWRWMEAECPLAGYGSEVDWLGFYYWIHRGNANAFSLTEIADIYKQACGGGTCDGKISELAWANLSNAVRAIHGATSPRALFWSSQGDAFGVDW